MLIIETKHSKSYIFSPRAIFQTRSTKLKIILCDKIAELFNKKGLQGIYGIYCNKKKKPNTQRSSPILLFKD